MTQASADELYMLELINEERTSRGLNPLQLEQNLNESAEEHSEWMLLTDTFSHTGVGGSSATDRMRDAGFDFRNGWSSAENIAIQTERGAPGIRDDIEDLHESLMDSPGHRANLLDPDLEYIGIGIEEGDYNYGSGERGSVVVTQNFASTNGSVDLDSGTGAPTPVATPAPTPAPGSSLGSDLFSGFGGGSAPAAPTGGGTASDLFAGGFGGGAAPGISVGGGTTAPTTGGSGGFGGFSFGGGGFGFGGGSPAATPASGFGGGFDFGSFGLGGGGSSGSTGGGFGGFDFGGFSLGGGGGSTGGDFGGGFDFGSFGGFGGSTAPASGGASGGFDFAGFGGGGGAAAPAPSTGSFIDDFIF